MGGNGTNIMTIRALIRECEAKIEQKDRIVWTVEDGVAYEESSGSLEPRRNTSAVKGTKTIAQRKDNGIKDMRFII
ncbi:unnamed protein product [Rhizophagus irregularis]|nr:unnamed protein product [Rhizophagus irregularis]CAB4446856.1 unnamed protein product [Rhizophagus irregularis]